MLVLIFLLGLPAQIQAAKGTPAASVTPLRVLDQKRIHTAYGEGDFERVIAAIDSFTSANKTYSHSDSVFIAKHLAVIYTANPVTREMGKNYMFRLLALLPSAKIVDMFVSDEIDHIFEKVREEYVIRRQSQGQDVPTHLESNQFASDKMTMKDKSTSPQESRSARHSEKKASHVGYWIAGGVTLVAVTGAAVYFLQPEKPKNKTYTLP